MGKTLGYVFGIVFVLVGVLGFISNPLVGDGSLFHTDTMHDIVHIVIGVVILIAAVNSGRAATTTIKVVAVVYLLLAIVGFLQVGSGETAKLLGLAEANAADNWLHLVLAVVLFGAAALWGDRREEMSGQQQPMM